MEYYVIIIIAAALVGLSKGGLGAMLGVLVTPMLSMVMPVQDAISLALPLLIFGDVFALYFYWKTWDMHYIRLMLPAAIPGIIVGTFLLARLDNITLRHILGIFTLIFVIYRVLSNRLSQLKYHPRDWHGYLGGAASGLGSALANNGGPPFTAYLLLQELSPEAFVGTATLFFAVVNLIKLPGLISAGLMDFSKLLGVIWVLPAIPICVFIGRIVIGRINKVAFEWFMLAVLTLASYMLLFVAPPA